MGDYSKETVRQADIHFIVNEINSFANCIENKEKLIGALNLSQSTGARLDQKYRLDGCNLYSYFTGIMSHWVNSKGKQATTVELDQALRSIEWIAVADSVKDKWFSAGRSTAANIQRVPIWFNMRNPISSFTGREDVLEQVHNIFFPANVGQQDSGKIKLSQVAIVGPSGIGKSAFARKFINSYYTAFEENVAWINAESAEVLQESFKELAAEIGIDISNVSSKMDSLNMIKILYDRISASNSLFIFDNVKFDGEDAIKDYLPEGLKPSSKTPYILMTSRIKPKVSQSMAIVDLSVLTETEAVGLIQRRLGTKNVKFPLQLAKKLGCLPLPLEQAISHIEQEIVDDISKKARKDEEVVAKYIQSYLENFDTEVKKSLDYKDMHTAWRVAIKKIQVINPIAVLLLKMMSYISPDGIHLETFKAQFSNSDLKAAISTLQKFSMITKNSAKSNIVSVHKLVQRFVRLTNEENHESTLQNQKTRSQNEENKPLESMLNLLNIILEKLPDKITHYTTSCVIHAQVTWKYAFAYPEMLKRFKAYPINLNNNARLHGMHQSILPILEGTLSKYNFYKESDEQYIRIQHLIACALLELHKYEDAKSLCNVIHKRATEKLGKSNQLTLAILNSLAAAEGRLGNYSEQMIILDEVIAASTASPNIGPCHKDTLTYFHNKAVCLRMGKYDEALELFKSTLELMKNYHPEDLESINRTRYSIALTRQWQRDFSEALRMFENLHTELIERFGESHPDTIDCAQGIAECLMNLGKYEESMMEVLKYNLNLANDNPKRYKYGMEILKCNMELAEVNPDACLQCTNLRFSKGKILLKMKKIRRGNQSVQNCAGR